MNYEQRFNRLVDELEENFVFVKGGEVCLVDKKDMKLYLTASSGSFREISYNGISIAREMRKNAEGYHYQIQMYSRDIPAEDKWIYMTENWFENWLKGVETALAYKQLQKLRE